LDRLMLVKQRRTGTPRYGTAIISAMRFANSPITFSSGKKGISVPDFDTLKGIYVDTIKEVEAGGCDDMLREHTKWLAIKKAEKLEKKSEAEKLKDTKE